MYVELMSLSITPDGAVNIPEDKFSTTNKSAADPVREERDEIVGNCVDRPIAR